MRRCARTGGLGTPEARVAELAARLQADLNAARKAQDKPGTLLLSTILADIKNRRIELGHDPSDDDVVDVLRKGIKKRREAIELYDKGNRPELAAKERSEVKALEVYLPAQVDPEELRGAVQAAIAGGATNIGTIMSKVLPQYKG